MLSVSVGRDTPCQQHLTMFLTDGLQDILPSNNTEISSVIFKINLLITLLAVVLFILFSLFVVCFIMYVKMRTWTVNRAQNVDLSELY